MRSSRCQVIDHIFAELTVHVACYHSVNILSKNGKLKNIMTFFAEKHLLLVILQAVESLSRLTLSGKHINAIRYTLFVA